MRCHRGVTAARGTPAVLPMGTGGQAGAANSLPWVKREKRAGTRHEVQRSFIRDESGQSRHHFFVKNTGTLGDKSAELASFKCHFPVCHLGII